MLSLKELRLKKKKNQPVLTETLPYHLLWTSENADRTPPAGSSPAGPTALVLMLPALKGTHRIRYVSQLTPTKCL